MRQTALRRKIQQIQERISALRAEIVVLNEQIAVLDDEVEELRVRSVVAETPIATREHAEAARHAALAHRARGTATSSLQRLEAERDALLENIVLEVPS